MGQSSPIMIVVRSSSTRTEVGENAEGTHQTLYLEFGDLSSNFK